MLIMKGIRGLELWKQVDGFYRYSVSDEGRVRNDLTERIMRLYPVNGKQLAVGLREEGIQTVLYVSRLVSEAFVPRPDNPYFNTPIHLDGDFRNCYADNLMWKPRYFAVRYARQFRNFNLAPRMIRNVNTGEEIDIWQLVAAEGLLYIDVVAAITERTVVFPIMQRFEWVE